MSSLTLALVLVTALSLVFDTTRVLGVLGFALLCVLHPVALPAVLLLGGAGFLLINHFRRSSHEP